MATNTPKLNLVKPEMSDYADVRVLNKNMDILDDAVGGLDYVKDVTKSDTGLTFTKKDDTVVNVPLDYMPITGGNFTGDVTIKEKTPMYIIGEGSSEQYKAKYIKYSNGTMVQMYWYYPQTSIVNYIDITFLQPFIEPPIIVGNRDTRAQTTSIENIYSYSYEVAFSTVTNTGCKASCDQTVGAGILVWGRWK